MYRQIGLTQNAESFDETQEMIDNWLNFLREVSNPI